MRHLNSEKLLEHLLEDPRMDQAGLVSGDSKAAFQQHLSECGDCRELKQELEAFVHRLQSDASYEPPAELVQWGLDLFQPIMQPATGGKLRKLIATLVLDTFGQPLQAGIRGLGAPSRQLLFRAGDVDVDVKIESVEANDRISMIGQVLAPSEKFFDCAPVRLESHGIVQYQTVTNPVGEFSFDEVPKDTYHLSVELPEGQITLFCVHRANS